MNKYWRGRLNENLTTECKKFISSIEEDKRLIEIDIEVNQAHCLMLYKQGIISLTDCKKIISSLEKAKEDWTNGKLEIDTNSVDIHPSIEKYIIDKCGIEIGGKIHTAKSRNDQVVTDIRLYTRNQILFLYQLIIDFINILLQKAKVYKKTIMPGYTHSMPAQITTVAHYYLSFVEQLFTTLDRLTETYKRINLSPLGACALIGTSFNIDRIYTSKLLGFDGIVENTIDAVSSRDFALEILSQLAILITGLSRMATDLIEWSTAEDNFLTLPEEFCDISSAMPQKRNPDVLEMIRAKTTKVVCLYSNLAHILVGLRTGYNKDLQETKLYIWEAFDIVNSSVDFLRNIVEKLIFNEERLMEIVEKSYISAPDLAEYLVKSKNISFRESYLIVGSLVNLAEKKKLKLSELKFEEIQKTIKTALHKNTLPFSLNAEEIKKVSNPYYSIKIKTNSDGPNPDKVENNINNKLNRLKRYKENLKKLKNKLEQAEKFFAKEKQKILNHKK